MILIFTFELTNMTLKICQNQSLRKETKNIYTKIQPLFDQNTPTERNSVLNEGVQYGCPQTHHRDSTPLVNLDLADKVNLKFLNPN